VWAAVAVLAFAMTIEIASAHDKGCDGNPSRLRSNWTATARPTNIS